MILGIILLIGVIYFYGDFKPQVFFFSTLPDINIIPNEIKLGETAQVKFSALLREIGAEDGQYAHGVYINKKLLCFNTAGTSNGDTYEDSCLIEAKDYKTGNNIIEVFQAYKLSATAHTFSNKLMSNYEGALAFDSYNKNPQGNKLIYQCIYGTPNGESYDSSDQRWYEYPLNTEWERLGGTRPGDSGGGDCNGARCRSCINYLSVSTYEKEDLNLNVVLDSSRPPLPPDKGKEATMNFIKNSIFYIIIIPLALLTGYLLFKRKK